MTDNKRTFDSTMCFLFQLAELESAPAEILSIKLGEEFGEFQEAALAELGFNQHKKKELEGSIGEAADIMNVLVSTLVKLHPELSPHEVAEQLNAAMHAKGVKYQKILEGSL